MPRSGSNLSTPRPAERNRDDAGDRVRSMPAEESSNVRRNDHMQRMPSNGYPQNGNGSNRPNDSVQDRYRDREQSRSSGGDRVEPRQYSQPPPQRAAPVHPAAAASQRATPVHAGTTASQRAPQLLSSAEPATGASSRPTATVARVSVE